MHSLCCGRDNHEPLFRLQNIQYLPGEDMVDKQTNNKQTNKTSKTKPALAH